MFIGLVLTVVNLAASGWPDSALLGDPRIAEASGSVDIEIRGSGGVGPIVFSPASCATVMAPADPCTDVLVVRNVGGAYAYPFTYSITVWADTNAFDEGAGGPAGDTLASCFSVNLVAPPPADGVAAGNASARGRLPGSLLAPGDSQTWGLEVDVDDDNACQGRSATIIARVVATLAFATKTPAPTRTPRPTRTPAHGDDD
jgi:hypothetical protein